MSYKLHAVVISKSVPIEEATKIAAEFIPSSRSYYRTTSKSYRFRNIPKTKFDKGSFRSKKIDNYITLVYGKLMNHIL